MEGWEVSLLTTICFSYCLLAQHVPLLSLSWRTKKRMKMLKERQEDRIKSLALDWTFLFRVHEEKRNHAQDTSQEDSKCSTKSSGKLR